MVLRPKLRQPRASWQDRRPRGRRAHNRAVIDAQTIAELVAQDREYTVWDYELPKFGTRVRRTGSRSFVVMFRHPRTRKQVRLVIGDCATMDPEFARAQARIILAKVDLGEDPTPAQAKNLNFREVWDQYRTKALPNLSPEWANKIQGAFKKRILPKLGDLPMESLTRADIRSVYEPLVVQHPPTALQYRRILSSFASWAVDRDYLSANPIKGTKLPVRAESRERVLRHDELAAVWLAAESLGEPWTSSIRLLMLTGQRKLEVFNIHAGEVSMDARVWEIPSSRTKNRRAHQVPIVDEMAAILETRVVAGGYLFTALGNETPMKFRQDIMDALRARAGVTNFRLHDLRRSAASHMAKLKVPPHVIEAVLNHRGGVISGVASVYNRYDYLAEKREALEKWASALAGYVRDHIRETAPEEVIL